MGITTPCCFRGTSVTAFATENRANGTPCRPNAMITAAPTAGVPGTDDAVGSCAGGFNELQDDVDNFKLLHDPPRAAAARSVEFGQPSRAARRSTIRSAARAATAAGVHDPEPRAQRRPGGIDFPPYSDFLAHDMGTLGDGIGNAGDSRGGHPAHADRAAVGPPLPPVAAARRSRPAASPRAVQAHDGQGASARDAFNALSASQRTDVVNFVLSM